MNGRLAKELRRLIYGETPFDHRIYTKEGNQVFADERRHRYQLAKRAFKKKRI